MNTNSERTPIHVLEAQNQDRTDEIIRRGQVAEGLRGILAVLNSNRSLHEILDYIVGEARRLLGADAVAIYRLLPDKILSIQSAVGLSEGYIDNSEIPLGTLATGQSVQRLQPAAFSNIEELVAIARQQLDQAQLENLQELARRFQSLLSVPLVIKGEPVGALTLYYTRARNFQKEDIDLAAAFGDQTALAIENARLREQVKEEAITAERSRIASDLHDSVTQMLFSASLIAEVLPNVWNRSQVEGQQALEELRHLTRGALAEMRSMLLELRPDQLQNAHLDSLLQQLATATAGRMHSPVITTIDGSFDPPARVRLGLYRIAQEALNNIAKHSSASKIAVTLTPIDTTAGNPSGVALTISDNGSGFDPQKVTADHLGLTIMRERAASIGAALHIISQPGSGTEIKVFWKQPGDKDGSNES
jgi:signal transduction histidine kinase